MDLLHDLDSTGQDPGRLLGQNMATVAQVSQHCCRRNEADQGGAELVLEIGGDGKSDRVVTMLMGSAVGRTWAGTLLRVCGWDAERFGSSLMRRCRAPAAALPSRTIGCNRREGRPQPCAWSPRR